MQNKKALPELHSYARSVNLPLKTALLSDEHLDSISAIFYKHMPQLVKLTCTKEKFKEIYLKNREMYADSLVKAKS